MRASHHTVTLEEGVQEEELWQGTEGRAWGRGRVMAGGFVF